MDQDPSGARAERLAAYPVDLARVLANAPRRGPRISDVTTKKISEEWLLIEWPDGEVKPTKYCFSTRDGTVTFAHLVPVVKQRWHIARDYLELQQAIGLGHFEGRPCAAGLRERS